MLFQKNQKMTVQALGSSMSNMQDKMSSIKVMKYKHQVVKVIKTFLNQYQTITSYIQSINLN